MFTPEFRALNREAALATRTIGVGLTALRRANYAQTGTYAEAFFNFTIGLERLAKLALILDHFSNNADSFPTDAELRKNGHDLNKLWQVCSAMRGRYRLADALASIPNDAIIFPIIDVLTDFAKGSRYYNLDYLVGGKAANGDDPLGLRGPGRSQSHW